MFKREVDDGEDAVEVPKKVSDMLIQDGTGRLFMWRPVLAARADMRPYFPDAPKEVTDEKDEEKEEVLVETQHRTLPANVIEEIIKVIPILHKMDFGISGLPRESALSRVLGYPITREQRDEAWYQFNHDQMEERERIMRTLEVSPAEQKKIEMFKCFDKMHKIDFATVNGMPTIKRIFQETGVRLSQQERKDIFKEWKQLKEKTTAQEAR